MSMIEGSRLSSIIVLARSVGDQRGATASVLPIDIAFTEGEVAATVFGLNEAAERTLFIRNFVRGFVRSYYPNDHGKRAVI